VVFGPQRTHFSRIAQIGRRHPHWWSVDDHWMDDDWDTSIEALTQTQTPIETTILFLELRDSHFKKQGAANGRPRFI
jgi:hypothetical protein